MDDFKNTYNSICRLCLCYSNIKKMVPLIDENNQNGLHGLTPYAKAVSTFANINITKEDSLPNNMCFKCLYLLKQAIHFKLLAESSDNCLKQLKNSVGSDCDFLKQKIIEFTMLKFYFPTVSFENTSECSKSETTATSFNKVNRETEKVHIHQITSENGIQDDTFDTPLDSNPDKDTSLDKDKLLDKIQSVMGLKSLNTHDTPVSVQKVFLRKKKGSKKIHLKPREQFIAIKKKSKEKNNFLCNICNKVLSNQVTYNHHMQRHNGCRYICEDCGKGFPVLAELHYHQVLRHGKGPYLKCSKCPFKAPKKFDLIEHERIHSGERPYTCDKCGLTFRRRGIWSKHLVYHSEKKIQCPHCPKKFFLRSEMLAHMNNIHNRVYIYACSKCDVTYAKTATVRRHLTERHGIPREMQGKIKRINKVAGYQESQ